jgi:nucleotide-binding universal stress UspA family protein
MKVLETTTNISFKNILLLTDFSEASQAASAYALGLARHFNAQLFPAHACDPMVLTEIEDHNLLDKIAENSEKQLTNLIKEKDVVAHPLFTRGMIETAFPRWIEENGIDLVVVGTHGRRGLQRLLMGSTAEFVFRNAQCPVLTVGPHVEVRPYSGFKADNILFPTDLGPHAEFAATYALSFAHEAGARLTFMHVISQDEAFQRDRTELTKERREKLAKLVPPDAELWCKPELRVEIGDPQLEVVGFAETERPDLIVLGLPQNKEFSAHFRTGVTYKTICSAPCPVLTIRDMTSEPQKLGGNRKESVNVRNN